MNFLYKTIIRLTFSVFFFFFCFSVGTMDAAHPWQVGFQDPATPIMEGIIFFNGLLMTFMLFIACLVGWLLYKSLTLFNEADHKEAVDFNHSTLLEVVWTIIPAGILMIISVPSYNLLYAMDEVIDPSLTIKVVGHQWYWSYECSDFEVSPVIKKDHLNQVEVSPVIKKDHLNQVEVNYKALKDMSDLIEYSRIEVAEGEKQTQITIIKNFLESFEKNIEDIPQEAIELISCHLEFLVINILGNEGRKEFYGPVELYCLGEMVSILSEVKNKLTEGSLIKEQQDLIIRVLKTFKQYLRIVSETELTAKTMELFKSLDEIKPGKDGKDGKDNPPSNDGGNDTNSIVAELNKVDEASYKWIELRSAENLYNRTETELSRALTQVFEAECVCLKALARGEIKISVDEMMSNLNKGRVRLNKALIEAEISENNLIDTQLIAHQLRLTRAEREGYSSEFEWDTAKVDFNFLDNERTNAKMELENAKVSAKWAKIDLLAAKVNTLTAEYFQADAEWASHDPAIRRSKILLKEGYDGWTKKLKLESKKFLEHHEIQFMAAHENMKSANMNLDRFQADLTAEELSKCNAIANNSEAEFMAIEKQTLSVEEECKKGKEILRNAKEELKNYKAVSSRADIRLERAQVAFDHFEAVSNRAEAILKGAALFFNTSKEKLTGVGLDLNSSMPKVILDNYVAKYNSIKAEFDKAASLVNVAKFDLASAKERFAIVKKYVSSTEKRLNDTPVIYKLPKIKDKSGKCAKIIEYFDNYLWEIHNKDLLTVKAQLTGAKSVLEESEIALLKAEQVLTEYFIKLIEVELKKGKALINFLQSDLDAVSDVLREKMLVEIKTYIEDLQLSLSNMIRKKVISLLDTENSKKLKAIITMLDNDLVKASSGLGLIKPVVLSQTVNGDISTMVKSAIDSVWLQTLQREVNIAMMDYEKASRILSYARKIFDQTADDLSSIDNFNDNSSIDSLLALQTATSNSLENTSIGIKNALASSSALETIFEPGTLQTKSCYEIIKAKAELANVKWFAARVSRSLDMPMSATVKPFNRQFFDISVADSNDFFGNDNGFDASGEDGNSGNKKSKKEIKQMLDQLKIREIDYTHAGLRNEILQTFQDLIETLDQNTVDDVKNMLYEALLAMTNEEVEKNTSLKTQIQIIYDLIDYYKKPEIENEITERQRINFDSYLITDDDLVIPEVSGTGKAGKVFRLLEVDNRLVVPINTHIRVLVTSADVLHSWAVPSLGVKVDACPGRLNQVFLFIKREGVFYGQCSELCGVNHGFMPIVVQAVNQNDYLTWVGKRLCS
uniref:cytochrome c oxidase subunit 2 n=1 Tax=Lessonia nigrescens TaxID=209404 RepID=UPI002E766D86|nr:cytochrome c oxidase subunit 2 [Lessonia nigrescens]WQB61678.1 cytochrome c oxidase subunit 2 [Lessonia nigrescens]